MGDLQGGHRAAALDPHTFHKRCLKVGRLQGGGVNPQSLTLKRPLKNLRKRRFEHLSVVCLDMQKMTS